MNGTTHLARSPPCSLFFSLPFNVTVIPTGRRPGHLLPSRLCMRRLVSSAYVWVYDACPRTTASNKRGAVHESRARREGGRAACPQRERDAPSRFTTSWRPAVRGSLCEPTPGVRASGPASRKALGGGAGARVRPRRALGGCGGVFMRDLYLRSLYQPPYADGPRQRSPSHLISSDPIRSYPRSIGK
jgi:hypothetical protein